MQSLLCSLIFFSLTRAVSTEPVVLTTMGDAMMYVTQGATLRFAVYNHSLCDATFPASFPPYDVSWVIDTATVLESGSIVTSHEREDDGSRYGLTTPVIRQIATGIHGDGTANIDILDFDPATFKELNRGSLVCRWNHSQGGMTLWAQTSWRSQINSLDGLQGALSSGYGVYYTIQAGICDPPVSPFTTWIGRVPDTRSNHSKTVTFTSHWAQGSEVTVLDVTTKYFADVIVKRFSYERPSFKIKEETTYSCILNFKGSVQYFYG